MGVSSAEWGFSNFSISERKAIGGTVKPRFRSEEIQGRAPRLSSGNLGQNLLGSPLLARPRGDKNRTTIRGHCVHWTAPQLWTSIWSSISKGTALSSELALTSYVPRIVSTNYTLYGKIQLYLFSWIYILFDLNANNP